MSRPLIVITTTRATAGSFGLPYVMLGAQYVAAVEHAGGASLLLTPAHSAESLERVMELAGGVVLSGGEDVDPARYGQAPHPALEEVNPARDAMELAVFDAAWRRGLPILAICRGLQLVNVALGGTLFQDLAAQRPGPVDHRQRAPVDRAWHVVDIEPGSILHDVAGVTRLHINSFHHQGIDELAPQLRAVAWSEDGLIEAIEARAASDVRWLCGVQWHPERGEAEGPAETQPNSELFRRFVEVAGEEESA